MRTHDSWTEEELARELRELDDMVTKAATSQEPGARVALAYLKQVRRDRRSLLHAMRFTTRQAEHS